MVKRVIPEGHTMCGLCSRLRRGALYRFASEHGITKIALGHHRDDIVETLFLNLFFGGRLKAMAPKLRSRRRRHIVIRPLAYVAERDIARYARGMRFPIIPCTLCGSQPNLQRNAVKAMLAAWEREQPGRIQSIFSALTQVEPATLADRRCSISFSSRPRSQSWRRRPVPSTGGTDAGQARVSARGRDWTRLSDEQLLQLRLCDLRLDLHALAAAAARRAAVRGARRARHPLPSARVAVRGVVLARRRARHRGAVLSGAPAPACAWQRKMTREVEGGNANWLHAHPAP